MSSQSYWNNPYSKRPGAITREGEGLGFKRGLAIRKVNKDIELKSTSAKVRKLMEQLRTVRRHEKAYKEFLKKLGNKNLRSVDYEKFFNEYGKDFTKVGIDPDTIRLKMDQIMEWRDDGNYKDNI